MRQAHPPPPLADRDPFRATSRAGWVVLLCLAIAVAGLLRFAALGDAPPGLYRDEAFNGLDALGVLRGEGGLYFPANNGREPAYIYLTALSIAALGRSALAVRLAAALIGTLTTWFLYRLGSTWFDRTTGLLAAWLWAITLWPIHLGRIGLRAGLLVPALALAFWLGTVAYRRGGRGRWALAGLACGATGYTYLAARFTPVLLLLWLPLLLWAGGAGARSRLRAGLPWFLLGAALALAPLAGLALQQPELVLGRAGQVSVLDPTVNGGNLPATLWRNLWHGLGLFFWRGDAIARHNPPGRPLFDPLLALPFLLGVAWCLRHLRRPAAGGVLLWSVIMLGPTILAEDAPHFLRAVGVLPAALLLAALGLRRLLRWERLPRITRAPLVAALLAGSLALTVRDYARYVAAPDTAFLFEAGARSLAEEIAAIPPERAVYLEQRLWEGWPSLPFLVGPQRPIARFRDPAALPAPLPAPAALYVWPHQPLDFVRPLLAPPGLVRAMEGALVRGDLEPAPYPLVARFERLPAPTLPRLARFGPDLWLRDVATTVDDSTIHVHLIWSADRPVAAPLRVFVHVRDASGLVAQDDGVPADGLWPVSIWEPGQLVADERSVSLNEPFDPARHQVLIGLYDAESLERLPLPNGGDAWPVP